MLVCGRQGDNLQANVGGRRLSVDEFWSVETGLSLGLAIIVAAALWLVGRQRRPPATKAAILRRLGSTDAATAAAALEARAAKAG